MAANDGRKGVTKAVGNIVDRIGPALVGIDVTPRSKSIR